MPRRTPRNLRRNLLVEQLETRSLLTGATLVSGVLTIDVEFRLDLLEVIRHAAGNIEIKADGITVPVDGGPASTANTTQIFIDGASYGDTVILDMTQGLFVDGTDNEIDIAFADFSGGFLLSILGQDGAGDTIDVGTTTDGFDKFYNFNFNGDADIDMTIPGYPKSFHIHGQGGNDTLSAAGNAVVGTFDPTDFIHLYFYGEAGDDAMTGGALNEVFLGGADTNTITGGEGYDDVWAFYDLDFTLTDAGLIVTDPNAGNAIVESTGFTDLIESGVLIGGPSANTIDASGFSDLTILYGQQGNDVIRGGSGFDLIYAGLGDDSVSGGDSYDLLYGGKGRDTFSPSDDAGERLDMKNKDTVAAAPFSPRALAQRSQVRQTSVPKKEPLPPCKEGNNVIGGEVHQSGGGSPSLGNDWNPTYSYGSPDPSGGSKPPTVTVHFSPNPGDSQRFKGKPYVTKYGSGWNIKLPKPHKYTSILPQPKKRVTVIVEQKSNDEKCWWVTKLEYPVYPL